MPQAPEKKPLDVVVPRGKTDDGEGVKVVRITNRDAKTEGEGRLEMGEVRPLKEGKPLSSGEVVRLTPREGAEGAFDVEPQLKVEVGPPSTRSSRPAQVATSAYRESWERIFGGERELN